jgi:hypothetical protein
MDGPVKVCASIVHSSVLFVGVKTTRDGELNATADQTDMRGLVTVPHDLNPPGAASL